MRIWGKMQYGGISFFVKKEFNDSVAVQIFASRKCCIFIFDFVFKMILKSNMNFLFKY